MPKKYLSFLVIFITLLSFSLARTAYCLDPIDPDWPVISQYVEAVKQLYPEYETQDGMAIVALATSKFVANDARTQGICGEWINSFNNCLTQDDPIVKDIACKATSKRLDLMYKDKFKLANITSDPNYYQNAHVLAAYVFDEFIYSLQESDQVELLNAKWCDIMDKMEMMDVGKTTGDPSRGSPTGASADAVPAGGNGAESSCHVGGGDPFHGGAGGPAPYSMGAGGISPSSLNQTQIGTQMPGANPCPINFSKAGWGAGEPDTESGEQSSTVTDQERLNQVFGFTGSLPEDKRKGGIFGPSGDDGGGGPKGKHFVVPIGESGLVLGFGGEKKGMGGSGYAGLGYKDPKTEVTVIAGHVGGGELYSLKDKFGNTKEQGLSVNAGGGLRVTFRPGPDSDLGGGICGLGSKINACFGAGESEEDKCRHEVMQKCMAATCDVEAMMGSCSSSGGAANALDLTKMPNYGVTDPVDQPQAAGPAPKDPLPGYMPRPKPGGPDPINPNFFRDLKRR